MSPLSLTPKIVEVIRRVISFEEPKQAISDRVRSHRYLLTLLLIGVGGNLLAEESRRPIQVTDAATRLHETAIVIDGHNDLPWELRITGSRSFKRLDISRRQPKLQTDIPRLRAGGLGAQFWSVYVPSGTADDGSALTKTLEQIQLVHAMMDRYPETFEFARSVADIRRIHQSGKIASLIGVEGGHSIENSLNVLRQLYDLGARYMTLTHAATLDWADSATDNAKHGGLTDFGKQVVHQMNRLGMLVDISHVSAATMRDALETSRAPLIFSHSSARAIADHPRNVSDEMLRLTAAKKGVVMVNFFSGYVVPESAQRSVDRDAFRQQLEDEGTEETEIEKQMKRWEARRPLQEGTIHDVLDHIDHIVKVAGVEYVGLGSDFDGVGTLPDQLKDVSTYPNITQGLLDRGYREDEIRKILGENLLRVFAAAEAVAAEQPN